MFTRFSKQALGAILFAALFALSPVHAQQAVTVDNTPRLAELASKLNFSEQQKKQLEAVLKKYQENSQTIQNSALKLRVEMKNMELSQLDAEKIAELSTRSGKVAMAHTFALLDTQREFYRLLNARQKNEYDRLRKSAKSAGAK